MSDCSIDSGVSLVPKEAESNRLCRRLQLKDIIPVEMQRLTKYPLLLESIAKYTGTVHRHHYKTQFLSTQLIKVETWA